MRVFVIVAFLGLLYVNTSLQTETKSLKFSLYYETLCPFCVQFITEQLYPAYHKIGSYLQVELIPYGNIHQKKVNGSWVFECQHGPNECAINKIEACGLSKSKDQAKIMEFVYCIESQDQHNPDPAVLAKCGTKLGLTSSEILKCSQGTEGDELLDELGKKQSKLNPKLNYVPWLLFNDVHDEKNEDHARANFLKTACVLLSNKPAGCSNDHDISVIEIKKKIL